MKNPLPPRPTVVTLCGSSRFIEQMAVVGWELEKAGKIMLGLHLLPMAYAECPDHIAEFQGVAARMDELHLRKIDMCDEVFVVNVDGYIGESTSREIAYAHAHGKPVRYLEPDLLTEADKDHPVVTFTAAPCKPWWPGDARVEPFMGKVRAAIKKHVKDPDVVADIYNRAYEAVYAAITTHGGSNG